MLEEDATQQGDWEDVDRSLPSAVQMESVGLAAEEQSEHSRMDCSSLLKLDVAGPASFFPYQCTFPSLLCPISSGANYPFILVSQARQRTK
jgi:hypothetical protein